VQKKTNGELHDPGLPREPPLNGCRSHTSGTSSSINSSSARYQQTRRTFVEKKLEIICRDVLEQDKNPNPSDSDFVFQMPQIQIRTCHTISSAKLNTQNSLKI